MSTFAPTFGRRARPMSMLPHQDGGGMDAELSSLSSISGNNNNNFGEGNNNNNSSSISNSNAGGGAIGGGGYAPSFGSSRKPMFLQEETSNNSSNNNNNSNNVVVEDEDFSGGSSFQPSQQQPRRSMLPVTTSSASDAAGGGGGGRPVGFGFASSLSDNNNNNNNNASSSSTAAIGGGSENVFINNNNNSSSGSVLKPSFGRRGANSMLGGGGGGMMALDGPATTTTTATAQPPPQQQTAPAPAAPTSRVASLFANSPAAAAAAPAPVAAPPIPTAAPMMASSGNIGSPLFNTTTAPAPVGSTFGPAFGRRRMDGASMLGSSVASSAPAPAPAAPIPAPSAPQPVSFISNNNNNFSSSPAAPAAAPATTSPVQNSSLAPRGFGSRFAPVAPPPAPPVVEVAQPGIVGEHQFQPQSMQPQYPMAAPTRRRVGGNSSETAITSPSPSLGNMLPGGHVGKLEQEIIRKKTVAELEAELAELEQVRKSNDSAAAALLQKVNNKVSKEKVIEDAVDARLDREKLAPELAGRQEVKNAFREAEIQRRQNELLRKQLQKAYDSDRVSDLEDAVRQRDALIKQLQQEIRLMNRIQQQQEKSIAGTSEVEVAFTTKLQSMAEDHRVLKCKLRKYKEMHEVEGRQLHAQQQQIVKLSQELDVARAKISEQKKSMHNLDPVALSKQVGEQQKQIEDLEKRLKLAEHASEGSQKNLRMALRDANKQLKEVSEKLGAVQEQLSEKDKELKAQLLEVKKYQRQVIDVKRKLQIAEEKIPIPLPKGHSMLMNNNNNNNISSNKYYDDYSSDEDESSANNNKKNSNINGGWRSNSPARGDGKFGVVGVADDDEDVIANPAPPLSPQSAYAAAAAKHADEVNAGVGRIQSIKAQLAQSTAAASSSSSSAAPVAVASPAPPHYEDDFDDDVESSSHNNNNIEEPAAIPKPRSSNPTPVPPLAEAETAPAVENDAPAGSRSVSPFGIATPAAPPADEEEEEEEEDKGEVDEAALLAVLDKPSVSSKNGKEAISSDVDPTALKIVQKQDSAKVLMTQETPRGVEATPAEKENNNDNANANVNNNNVDNSLPTFAPPTSKVGDKVTTVKAAPAAAGTKAPAPAAAKNGTKSISSAGAAKGAAAKPGAAGPKASMAAPGKPKTKSVVA